MNMLLKAGGILVISFLLNACDRDELISEPELRPVRVFEVDKVVTVRTRTFSGISQSALESRLSFKVGGTIIELPVQVGDELKKDQTVAKLDPSTYELEVAQARSKLLQAKANQRNAASNYERVKGLYENSNVSKNELDSARASAETAEAEVSTATKSVEISELNKSYTTLASAADCTVVSIAVDLNENVIPGNEIATVNCGGGIEVRVGVPEGLIDGLTRGSLVKVSINTIDDMTFSATITEIGVGSASSSSTFPVIVAIDGVNPGIRPGMAAQVTFSFPEKNQDIHIVPTAAVTNDSIGPFVYIAEPSGESRATVTRQYVEVGELTAQGVEIYSGVSQGDVLITAGLNSVFEGQTVLVPRSQDI